MKILLVGGTGFTGPPLVKELLVRGHEVAVFHRGRTHDDRTTGAEQILGDRKDARQLAEAVANVRPDIAVDMIPFTERDALEFMQVCRAFCMHNKNRPCLLPQSNAALMAQIG